jgi:hypothetical protein
MKSYTPRPGDIAMDLQRCFEISVAMRSFQDKTFRTFFRHALIDLKATESNIDKTTLKNVRKCLKRVLDSNLDSQKRREDLLTASGMLLNC